MTQPSIAILLAEIDRARAGLYDLLRSADADALTKRPPSGDWSAIENVRHLLFAEQLHLGKFLPGGFEWSRVGLSGRTGRAYAAVGTERADDLEHVLEAWDAVHAQTRDAAVGGGAEARQGLERNLKHLARHIATIRTLLDESGG